MAIERYFVSLMRVVTPRSPGQSPVKELLRGTDGACQESITSMPPDLHVVQAALVAIAVAVWLHMLLLIAGLGILVKAWKATRDDLQHRFAELQTRIDQTTVAAQQTMAALDRCATQTSHILQVAERLASAIGALTTPPSWISTGSASRLVSRWRRRSKSTPTPET